MEKIKELPGKLYEKLTANRWLLVVLAGLLCFGGYFAVTKIVPKMGIFCKNYSVSETIDQEIPLTSDKEVTQDFVMPFDRLNGLSLYFGKGNGNNIGSVTVELLDAEGTAVNSWILWEALLPENDWQEFSIGELVQVVKGEMYSVRVRAQDNDSETANIGCAKSNRTLALRISGRENGIAQTGLFTAVYLLFSICFLAAVYFVCFGKSELYMFQVDRLDWVLFGVVVICCALFFSQYSDMEITVRHAEDLTYAIKNGDVMQFYDITMAKALNGEYGNATILKAANYNIFLYLALAVMILPWTIVKALFKIQYNYVDIVMYVQILLIFFNLASAKILGKICVTFGYAKEKAKITEYLFLSSAITMFATVGFGQLDIIYLFVMLLALLYFARGQYYRFSLIMSVAIMLKSFPVLLFIPLILLTNKKIHAIMINLFLGLSASLLYKLAFGGDYGYAVTQEKLGAHYDFMGRLTRSGIGAGMGAVSLFVLFYVLLCIWAFAKKDIPKEKLFSYVIYSGVLIYGMFAVLILWHPQWLLILSLFIAMAVGHFERKELLLYCDLGLSCMYLAVTSIYYKGGVDNYMMNYGLMGRLTDHTYQGITISEIAGNIDNIQGIAVSVFAAVLIAFICILAKQLNQYPKAGGEEAGSRILIWLRSAVMYVYCLVLCIFFFFLG